MIQSSRPDPGVSWNFSNHLYEEHPKIYILHRFESRKYPNYFHPTCKICNDFKYFFYMEAAQEIDEYRIEQLKGKVKELKKEEKKLSNDPYLIG